MYSNILNNSQRAHDVYTTSAQRRCNVMTLHRSWGDVVLTSCVRWEGIRRQLIFYSASWFCRQTTRAQTDQGIYLLHKIKGTFSLGVIYAISSSIACCCSDWFEIICITFQSKLAVYYYQLIIRNIENVKILPAEICRLMKCHGRDTHY